MQSIPQKQTQINGVAQSNSSSDFFSVTKKLRELNSGRGGNRNFSDSRNKVYASIQCNIPTQKMPIPRPVIAFYIGVEVCKAARFMVGDYIEVLYSRQRKAILLRRTNDRMAGYKLSFSGGNSQKTNPSTMIVKIKYDESLLPKINDLVELKNVTINEQGVIGNI